MEESHESYAIMSFSRVQGDCKNLFGSSINHQITMKCQIKRAIVDRHSNRDWYHGGELLCEVEMSQTQFAELITSLNYGVGVPCTLRHFGNRDVISDPPERSQRKLFEKEFQETLNNIETQDLSHINDLLTKKGPLSVTDRHEILQKINNIVKNIKDSIPFIQQNFKETMDKTINDIKGELEVFIANRMLANDQSVPSQLQAGIGENFVLTETSL